MAMALAMESPRPALAPLGMNLGMGMQVMIDEEDDREEDEEQEIDELGQEEDLHQHQTQQQDSSLFGPVHRQKRRQEIPRARRRSFPSFDPSTGGHETLMVSRCSTFDDETAICSTVVQSRDCMETPVSIRSPTISMNLSEDGDSSLSCALWSPGQLVWAKFPRSPWWPSQVVDERLVNANIRAQRQSKAYVLVRFFGNYNYGWVDPASNLSKFDASYDERSQVTTKTFRKALKEALEYRDNRKLPVKWKQEECQTPHGNGKESSEDTGSEALEFERTTSARRRKPKVLYEDEERLHQKPKRNLRRKRIMRELGLCAPYGSPFTTGTSV